VNCLKKDLQPVAVFSQMPKIVPYFEILSLAVLFFVKKKFMLTRAAAE